MIKLPFALRSLLKTPLVTGVAILSLALGIGANAAIFSIFEQFILAPLPVESPEELVNLSSSGPKSGSTSTQNAGGIEYVFSYPMFRDLEKADSGLVGLAAHYNFGANLTYEGNTQSSSGLLVSGSYFEVLKLRPAVGRLLSATDDITPGAHPLVVLDHGYWLRRFDADPDIAGRPMTVNGQPMTIVGVAPPGFQGTTLGSVPEFYTPISMRDLLVPSSSVIENRRSYWIYLFGRLAPGMTLEQVGAVLNGTYRGVIQGVEVALQTEMSERTLERFKAKELSLEPGRRGQSDMHANARTPLLLLLGVTGLVLLIAGANIANLLLVKAANRSTEIAVRLSVGAQRHQVVRQLLAESFFLAGLGSLVGIFSALGILRLMAAMLPGGRGAIIQFQLGPTTWLFMLVLALVTGLVGLFPALHSTRSDLVTSLKSQAGRASDSRGARRFRAVMITLQISLSMALLISAGLFAKSLLNVSRVDLGIDDIDHLAMFSLSPRFSNYTPQQSRQLFERVEEELSALPGVHGVAASMVPLIAGSNWMSSVTVQGFTAEPDANTSTSFNKIGSEYFSTLGVTILAGREFDHRDALTAPKVAIVNQAFAEKFDLGQDVVGKRMEIGSGGELDIEIVGLVPNTHYSGVKQAPPPLFYLPYQQDESIGSLAFYVRSGTDPKAMLSSIRAKVAEIDSNLPINNLQTMAMQIRQNIFVDRSLSTLSAAFAILATILAAIGLYGVLAYSVAQRTREIGLRMALGADGFRVWRLILSQVGRLTAVGAVLGLAGALGLGRLASSLLFGLEGHDPLVFALSLIALTVVAFGAGAVPAYRAARVDPMKALRDE